MAEVSIKNFAEQIGIPIDKLMQQLDDAGIGGKRTDDVLSDTEVTEMRSSGERISARVAERRAEYLAGLQPQPLPGSA